MIKNITRMRILGIDPGTAITGYAILDSSNGQLVVRDLGCITTQKSMTQSEKLEEIASCLTELIILWKPQQASVEKLFFSQNVTTAVTVAQARGVILQTLQCNCIPHDEYLPKEIKATVCGDGSADKKAIQKMVKILCNLQSAPRIDDAADALAVAICHAQQLQLKHLALTAQ